MNSIINIVAFLISFLRNGLGAKSTKEQHTAVNRRPTTIFLFVLCTLYSVLTFSQSFPVQVIPQAIPPAPIYVSSYADASTISSPLRVQIILNDFEIANREIRLKTYFEGSRLSFQSNDIVVGATPLFLEGGIPLVLTNVELAPYFQFENITGISPNQYGKAIPEGAYQFCVEVYDVLTGSRLSNKSCAVSVVFQNEPPFLVLPRNKTNVDEINPQYIIFQWTPRSINVSNVAYELSLVEIWDNQVDPQQAFLSSPPVFQTTTSATTYVYGPSDPLLLSGKNYAWRVQAKAKQGTEEIGLFKNQGHSEIFSFSYAGSCDLPLTINHEVKGSTNANIFWDDFSTEIPEFTVRYRQKGNNNAWFLSKTTTNLMTLWGLKAGATYEYQVLKKCAIIESDWSLSKQFTTFIADDEASVYECGISPDFNLSNQEPLQTIGEKFTAGDFPIKVLEASGSNGRFTGKGYVTIPYLSSIRVGVEFTNVLINTDNQLIEGSVITMYDPSLSNILDIDEVIDTIDDVTDAVGELFEGDNDLDEMRVNFPIPKDKVKDIIKIVDGNVVITNPENGESISEPLGDDKVVVDGTGQVYHIDAGGNITEGGQIDPGGAVNSGNVDGVSNNGQIEQLTAEGILVAFNTPSTYGFDQMPSAANEKLKKEYTITKDAKGNDYVLAHHSVKKGGDTQIKATITLDNNTYTAKDVIFKTKQGEVIPKTVSGNTVTLTIKGTYTFENETIYAVVPSKEEANKQLTAGAFALWHLTDRVVDVVLVSVNGASLGAIESTVENIYKKGVATINFGDPLALSVTPSDLGSNGLDVGESAWLGTYNDEQKQLVSAVQSLSGYQSDTYYILVFGNDIQPSRSIAGFMPLQRQMGFVFSGSGDEEGKDSDKGKVLAHELGHGVFALQHPFGQFGAEMKNKTDWLMDYNGGTTLPHTHWAQIHDPALKFYVFQKEEDGQSTVVKQISSDFQNYDGTYTFMTLNGSYITLPENVKDLWFSTGLDQLDKFVDYPAGALIRFTVEDDIFRADVERSDILFGDTAANEVFFEKDNLTFTYRGFKSEKTGKKYESEDYKDHKIDGYVICLIPYTASNGTVQGIGGYSLQRVIRKDLSFQEGTNFNILNNADYENILRFYNVDANLRKHLEYKDKTFPYQFELQKALMDEIVGLGTWSAKHPLLVKYAILYNSQPDVFKSVVKDIFGKSYIEALKAVSLQELKEAYPKVITGIFNQNTDLVNQFYDIVDGKRNLLDKIWFEKLHEILEKLSSEQITTKIDFERRKKALAILLKKEDNKYLYNSLYENLVNTDRYEDQILRLIKFIPDSQVNELISYLESDKNNNEEHLWHFIFRKTDDTFIWNNDNRGEFVKIVTEKYFKSTRFAEEYKKIVSWEGDTEVNRELIDRRNIDSEYRDIFQRTWTQLKIANPVIREHIDNFDEGDLYIKYDTDYLKGTGRISVEKTPTIGFMTNSAEPYFLKPFDLIFFRTSSNLALLRDYKTSELKPVPAIVLYYDDDKRNSDTTNDVIYTVVDVATLVIPGAQFAQLGKIGRIFFILDKASSVTSLTANAIENADPETSKILNQVSLVLGVTDLTNITGNAIKARLAKNLDQISADYKTAVNLIDETNAKTIDNLTDAQKKDIKTILAAEYDALKSAGISDLDELKLTRVTNKLDGLAEAGGGFAKLSTKSSLSTSLFNSLDNALASAPSIKFNYGTKTLQNPKQFLNATGSDMYDIVLSNGAYTKFDKATGRMLYSDGANQYFVRYTTGNNVANVEQLINTRVTQLRNCLGLNGSQTIQLTNGLGSVTTNSNKVTTFVGKIDQTQLLKNQFGDFKHIEVGETVGSVNLLNMPDTYFNGATWFPDYNQGWMQRAINRGDDIYIASPINNSTLYNDYGGSYFAKELNELVSAGIKPKNVDLATWNSLKTDIITASGTKY